MKPLLKALIPIRVLLPLLIVLCFSYTIHILCLQTLDCDHNQSQSPSQEHLLLITMQTRSRAFSMRQMIRDTLFQQSYFQSGQVKLLFTIARPEPYSETVEAQILSESASHGDVFYLSDIPDIYRNIGAKHDRFLQYANTLPYRFQMKLDDDCYVNFSFLIPYLEAMVEAGEDKYYYLLGNHQGRGGVSRDPSYKYFASYSEWPYNYIPRFLRGHAGIWTASLMRMLYDRQYNDIVCYMEDAIVGKWVENYQRKEQPKEPWDVHFVELPHWILEVPEYQAKKVKELSDGKEFYNVVHHADQHQLECLYLADLNGADVRQKYKCIKRKS